MRPGNRWIFLFSFPHLSDHTNMEVVSNDSEVRLVEFRFLSLDQEDLQMGLCFGSTIFYYSAGCPSIGCGSILGNVDVDSFWFIGRIGADTKIRHHQSGRDSAMTIRMRLHIIMSEKRMTYKELALKIGVTEANLSILRSGDAKAI